VRVLRGATPIVVLVWVSVAFSACGGAGGDDRSDPASAGPQGMVEAADFDGVHSGELEIALEIDNQGKEEEVNMRILGSFLGAGEEDLPQLDMAIESNGTLAGRKVDFNGGLAWLSGYAVVNYDAQTYQLDKAPFEDLRSKFEEARQEGDEGNAMACVEAAQGIEVDRFVGNFTAEGHREGLDGAPLTAIGGDLNVPGAIDALIQLTEDPACGAQLQAAGVPSATALEAGKRALKGRIDEAQAQLAVDKQGVVRSLSANVVAKGAKGEDVEVELDVRLLRVNEVTEFPQPTGYASFEQLLKKVGVDSAALEQADGGAALAGFLEGVGELLRGREGF
jgi:hypothetical protein